jgi:hypothetical protein
MTQEARAVKWAAVDAAVDDLAYMSMGAAGGRACEDPRREIRFRA